MRSQHDEAARVWNALLCVDVAASSKQGMGGAQSNRYHDHDVGVGIGLMNE